jgi:signal transduction histidine kinase
MQTPRLRISMRWWLATAFAAIVALTAVAVAELFTQRAEDALAARAEELATGSAVAAARELTSALGQGDVQHTLEVLSTGRKLSLFVFTTSRRPLATSTYGPVRFGEDPLHRDALARSLGGRRFVESSDGGRTIVVGLPLGGGAAGALVAVARRSDLVAEAALLRDEIVRAALWAVLVGGVAGLVVALLIAARLRRISSAAASIESGSFDAVLRPGLHDEVGELAATIDRMRVRLGAAFRALESERDRLRSLFEQLHDGVIAVDDELRVVLVNRTARLLVGPELVEGEPLPEPWDELSLRQIAARLFEPGAALAQGRMSPDDDTTLAVAGIPARSGPLALLVISDVSARERQERAEREFVANAAHELRTPITAIANAVEALETGAKEDSLDRDRFIAVIDRQSRRLGRLVRALLALARAQTRQEPLRLEPVALPPVLAEVAEALDPTADVEVVVDCVHSLEALAQRDLLVQVVGNLAANAARHTARGRIVLAARPAGAETVVIEVADTGRGIPQAEAERVFDRFYSSDRGRRDGFGLGLAIVREAVRALGGVVEVESLPGRGTTARVTLAAAQADG